MARFRFQFSLKSIFVVFVFAALGLAAWGLLFPGFFPREYPNIVVIKQRASDASPPSPQPSLAAIHVVVSFSARHKEEYSDIPPFGTLDAVALQGPNGTTNRFESTTPRLWNRGATLVMTMSEDVQERYEELLEAINSRQPLDSLSGGVTKLLLPRDFPTLDDFLAQCEGRRRE